MTTKWKCNVCGEIFSYLPEICPVCGAKKSAFSKYQEEQIAFQKDTNEKFVIVGGGIAALQTAKAIRARNKTADITIICKENKIPYNRPALSDLICKGLSFADIVLENYNYYKDNNITIIRNVEATEVDKKTKMLTLSNGDAIEYDKLCIATGANAFNPFKITNDMLPTKTLRSFEDAQSLLTLLKDKGNKVIIAGGGILGIEAAVAFNNRGASITVIERNSCIAKAQLDEYASQKLKKAMQAKGINVITDSSIKEINSQGIILNDNKKIQADFMLVSMGVRSQIALAQKAELDINRAIIVDDYMKTDNSSIYAAGDCAEHNGISGGLWIISSAQGKTAGANMAGDELKYQIVPFATAFEGLDISFFAVGNINRDIEKTEIYEQNGVYKKLAFINNKLVGALLWQDTSLSNKAMELVAKNAGFDEAKTLLTD